MEKKYLKIMNTILETGGATVDYQSLKVESLDYGYMVSLFDFTTKIPMIKIIENESIFENAIKDKRNLMFRLAPISNQVLYLGFWNSGIGTLYIDISVLVEDIEDAKHIAKFNNQLAFYDNYNKVSIYVN